MGVQTLKKKRIMVAVTSILWAIAVAGAFAVGLSMGQRAMLSSSEVALENIQAKLLFNRIEDERHLGDLLNRKCMTAASDFVNYINDSDMQLMHKFVVDGKVRDAFSYINIRNPEILKEAMVYSSRFPNPWKETACN